MMYTSFYPIAGGVIMLTEGGKENAKRKRH